MTSQESFRRMLAEALLDRRHEIWWNVIPRKLIFEFDDIRVVASIEPIDGAHNIEANLKRIQEL